MTATGERRRTALVVDDEEPLAALVAGYLEREGFATTVATNGESAVRMARSQPPDVVVLDVMLPGIDGVEVCRQLRTFSDCYIVMLTARAEEIDTLIGLSVGADDYMTKPFSPRELVARVKTLFRRPRTVGGPEQPGRTFGSLVVDPAGRVVTVDGTRVEVTKTEFDVLEALSAAPRQVFTRRQLIDVVWGPHWVGDEHVVDVHIGHLRRKLGDDPNAPRFVRTVRGVGYQMGLGQ